VEINVKKQSLVLRIIYFPLTRIILGCGAVFGIGFALKRFLFAPLPGLINIEGEMAKSIEYFLSILGVFLVYYVIFRLYEGRKISELSGKHLIPESLIGFFGGFLCISIVLLILYIFGHFRILSSYSVSALLLPMTGITLFALIEEIIFRGIFYRITEETLGTIIALILTSIPFGVFHIFNQHANVYSIISATLGGVCMGMLYTLTKRLWVPIFAHVGWNFAQVFFLSNVSSVTDYTGFFESRLEGPTLIIGGKFGIEDSLISSALLILLCTGFFYLAWKKGRLESPFWKKSP
jgi:membrane protease YdiL (CAAX protease family)